MTQTNEKIFTIIKSIDSKIINSDFQELRKIATKALIEASKSVTQLLELQDEIGDEYGIDMDTIFELDGILQEVIGERVGIYDKEAIAYLSEVTGMTEEQIKSVGN